MQLTNDDFVVFLLVIHLPSFNFMKAGALRLMRLSTSFKAVPDW